MSSGISASPDVSTWCPLIVAVKLTMQYGDQLNKKATMVAMIINTVLCWYLLRCARMKGSKGTGKRLSNL